MKTSNWTLLISIIFPCLVWAAGRGGPGDGGGGNLINCDGKIELLDYWQAKRSPRNLILDLGPQNLSYEEKVRFVLKRIQKLNPNRYALYTRWLVDFSHEVYWEKDSSAHLNQIDDVGVLSVPGNCKIIQTVAQQNPDLPDEKRYTILEYWWNQLDNDNKAGMILHEIILRELKNQDTAHATSKYARYFNGILSSTSMIDMTLRQYLDVLRVSRFDTGDAQDGIVLNIFDLPWKGSEITYWNENTVRRASINNGYRAHSTATPEIEYSIYGTKVRGHARYYSLDADQFFKNGKLMGFEVSENQKFRIRHPSYLMAVDYVSDRMNNLKLDFKFNKYGRYGLFFDTEGSYSIGPFSLNIHIKCKSGKSFEFKDSAAIVIEPETGELELCQ